MQRSRILFYFYAAFTICQLVKSHASNTALNHIRIFQSYNAVACATYLPGNKSKILEKDNKPPILKATYYLVKGFTGIANGNNNNKQKLMIFLKTAKKINFAILC